MAYRSRSDPKNLAIDGFFNLQYGNPGTQVDSHSFRIIILNRLHCSAALAT